MSSPRQGIRRISIATAGLALAAVAGTVAVGAAAQSTSATPTASVGTGTVPTTQSRGDEPGSPGGGRFFDDSEDVDRGHDQYREHDRSGEDEEYREHGNGPAVANPQHRPPTPPVKPSTQPPAATTQGS